MQNSKLKAFFSNKRNKLIFILSISFLLLCIGAIAILFFTKQNTKDIEISNDALDTTQTEIDNQLVDISGDLRMCYEEALGKEEFEQLQRNDREINGNELIEINKCKEELGYVEEPENAQTPAPSSGEAVLCVDSEKYEYSYIGKIITQTSTGINDGVIADSSAILLDDGRVRIYFGWTDAVLSATSTTVFQEPYEEIEFELDSGERVSGRYGHPRIVKDDSGKYYLYSRLDQNIYSFTSSDGLSFDNKTLVLTNTEVGMDTVTGVGLVKYNGTWRMYVSNILTDEDKLEMDDRPDLYVKSLVTTDLDSSWEVESGVRLGRGSEIPGFIADDQNHIGQAEHPMALVNSHNEVMLVFRGTDVTCFSKSSNGIDFEQPILISNEKDGLEEFAGGDADIIEIETGVYLVTGTNGGPTLEGHIRMGILREK